MPRLRRSKPLQLAGIFGVLVIALAGIQLSLAPQAQAANANEFNPGNIISDDVFYHGSAMTAAEIQAFLNARLPRCIIGDPGYAAGSVRGSNTIANQCLKDFSTATASKAANAYCAAYQGTSRESAAQIIEKVALACGISPKVLLVMLEKEQSLVSDSWPYVRQFDVAMGYACPDSGPGNSANCDSAYYGFHNQVYRSAWQLKVYKANPGSFRYRPFQVNTIQWHPNVGCGTSQVYIENWATASLYIYTPYRPNPAALNAQWGIGDACSTYGNRNFFMFFTTWFGSTQGVAYPEIESKRAQNPWLGTATTDYNWQPVGSGGVVRGYENGAIAWQKGSRAAYILTGDFRSYFGGQGGISGKLGWPASDQSSRAGGRTQGFQGGAVSWTEAHGFATISGKIRTHYADWALAYDGPLGWPAGEQTCTSNTQCVQAFDHGSIQIDGSATSIIIPAIELVATAHADQLGATTQTARAQSGNGGGFVQAHKNGAIAWSEATGAHMLSGAIRAAYGATGGVGGPYGWPTAEQVCAADGSCSQAFTGGIIQLDENGKSTSMSTDIRESYDSLLQSGVDLGKSLGETRTVTQGNGGRVHAFENGAIAASERTGAYAVMAPIRDPFNAAGGLGGPLGWPTNNVRTETSSGGGVVQGFEGGAITNSTSGTFVLSGAMRTAFGDRGGLSGPLGWPQSNAIAHTVNGGGHVQTFQGGALVQRTGTTAPVLLAGDIRGAFGAAGGLAGLPGWPTGEAREESANGGGTVQGFQKAAIASSASGAYLLTGDIRTFFNAQGGLTGSLGWPTSAATISGQNEQQSFQGGVITRNTASGVIEVQPLR